MVIHLVLVQRIEVQILVGQQSITLNLKIDLFFLSEPANNCLQVFLFPRIPNFYIFIGYII